MHLTETLPFLWPFLASAGFVTLNEMGDKTQLLAMAMATRIKFLKVMAGVLIATLLNHGLAVAAGSLLASVPGWRGWVQLVASVLFVLFGLWALVGDDDSGTASKKSRFGDVATVAVAFFIAEMGDKTQLATIALAAKYPSMPLVVLAGTTVGMLIADGIGILIGVILNRRLPQKALRLFAAGAFIVFGLAGLWESLRGEFGLPPAAVLLIVAGAAIFSAAAGRKIYGMQKKG
ncbi:MAG: TMEM165/GDT1 family protein [Clostridia bacterium]|nr:TMEM165/GDT1 family protein [Clostridia bacterium]MDR3645071.1 TMEM165/GDT1 family protein [Clostridia bacterium]